MKWKCAHLIIRRHRIRVVDHIDSNNRKTEKEKNMVKSANQPAN